WARQMLDYVAARIHPMERLHALSARLSASPDATSHDVDDYRWVMDRLLGDTLAYPYPDPARVAEMAEGDDLTDWILARQGGGASGERAVARWQATRSVPWLVAVLWRAPDDHPGAAAALDAAAAVDRSSPAYPTVAVMRVRALARAGRRDEARRALAALPDAPSPGFDWETVNFVRAERVMLADSLAEFLSSAR